MSTRNFYTVEEYETLRTQRDELHVQLMNQQEITDRWSSKCKEEINNAECYRTQRDELVAAAQKLVSVAERVALEANTNIMDDELEEVCKLLPKIKEQP